MKYSVTNTSSLQTGEIIGVDLLPIETFVPTQVKKFTQHYIFSRVVKGIVYTWVIKIAVSGSRCETEVSLTKFNEKLGTDSSYRKYSGGNNLLWEIDTENDQIYYLSDLAAAALNHSIATTTNGL